MNIVDLFGSIPTASQSVATSITLWRISSGLFGPRRKRVLVRDQKIAIKLILHRQPIFDRPDVMPEMQFPGRRISREYAGLLIGEVICGERQTQKSERGSSIAIEAKEIVNRQARQERQSEFNSALPRPLGVLGG